VLITCWFTVIMLESFSLYCCAYLGHNGLCLKGLWIVGMFDGEVCQTQWGSHLKSYTFRSYVGYLERTEQQSLLKGLNGP
jgi:hypothetical protein